MQRKNLIVSFVSIVFFVAGSIFLVQKDVLDSPTAYVVLPRIPNRETICQIIGKPEQTQEPTLQDAIDSLNWTVFNVTRQGRWTTQMMEEYQNKLVPFLETIPADATVFKRPVSLESEMDCSREEYSNFLTGRNRNKQEIPKVYDFFMFNCELDILETRLYELNETVDLFILMESTHSHRGVKKPLFYARNYERFIPFANKIVHLVSDFSDTSKLVKNHTTNQTQGDMWLLENAGRDYMWREFLKTLSPSETVKEEDLLIGGDLDEIPSGRLLYHLKHCEIRENAMPIGVHSYFYRFNFGWLFQPHDLPTIFTRSFVDNRTDFCRNCDTVSTRLFRF